MANDYSKDVIAWFEIKLNTINFYFAIDLSQDSMERSVIVNWNHDFLQAPIFSSYKTISISIEKKQAHQYKIF